MSARGLQPQQRPGSSPANRAWNAAHQAQEGGPEEPALPTKDEHQREEFFHENLRMIEDANRIYQHKTAAMHREIFELEEEFRRYSLVKEQLESPNHDESSLKSKKKEKQRRPSKSLRGNEEPMMAMEFGCEAPIDMDQIKTIEEAKSAYNQLLLDYLEHQSVLDTIIGAKKTRVTELRDELTSLGWSEPVAEEKNKKKGSRGQRLSSVWKLRGLGYGGKSSQEATPPPKLPEGPIVSKLLYSNKDILGGAKDGSSAKSSTVTPESFTTISVIGQGAFGKVYLVMRNQTGQLMAMKVMKKNAIMEDGDDALRHVIHELEFMRDMSHHPFIVSLYHAFQTNKEVSLVMEWIGGGTLFEYLVKKDTPFNENEARFFGAQVLLALQSLHANNIVYRDLKLENILLDEDGYVRLSDFGLSARARRGEKIHSFSGTATYLAPEIILDNGEDGHTHCVDIWCFGVMLFIMLTQEPPFWSEHYPDLFHLIKTMEIPFESYEELSPDAISLLRGLLTKDPNLRFGCGPMGIVDIQEHPFFRTVDWKALLAKKLPPPIRPKINKGKKEEETSEGEQGEPEAEDVPMPAEIFKGFSFIWNPDGDDLLSESIEVLQGETPTTPARPLKKKNRVIVNFFLWLKEIQGMPASYEGQSVYVSWKHEAKRFLTVIGVEGSGVVDQTGLVTCQEDRSASLEGSMDNACIACDYEMLQDRKSLSFDSRLVTFQLMVPRDNKKGKHTCLGKATIDLSNFCYHKLNKTQIFSFGESGVTLVLSIMCSWKSFNGDLVDNYDASKAKPKVAKQSE